MIRRHASGMMKSVNNDFDAALLTTTEEDQQAAYDEIYAYMNEQAMTIPLYYGMNTYIYNNRLTGVEISYDPNKVFDWSKVDIAQ